MLSRFLGKKPAAPPLPNEPPRDATREIFETVVFVVTLVLMLKLFVAEAFVIPTGSMASTLWGDQQRCTCRECGHKFPINASENGKRGDAQDYLCENCGFQFTRWYDEKSGEERKRLSTAEWNERVKAELRKDLDSSLLSSSTIFSGDRVLVSKYEYHLRDPKRFEVPVFKFPKEPYSPAERSGMNYIKRLVGLGGETLAVFDGDLYTTRELKYDNIPPNERPQRELDAWLPRYMYQNNPDAIDHFRRGRFEIVRKSPDEILAMRRIVFDLDRQPKSLEGIRRMRWHAQEVKSGWAMQEAGFRHEGASDVEWMRYQHIDPWNRDAIVAYLIIDYLGYNVRGADSQFRPPEPQRLFQRFDNDLSHWVSDLALDCTVEIASPDDTTILELAKGKNRFRATFTGGECKLSRVIAVKDGEELREMGSHPTSMTSSGSYKLRFANFDARLTVWVDGKALGFGRDQSDYPPSDPAREFEPYEANDLLQPARVGARGNVTVSRVSLWRDLQYRCSLPQPGPGLPAAEARGFEREWGPVPTSCGDVQTYFVQPDHYLMFGDNVNSSADSRSWGQVPSRLMLGRAVVIYWPWYRWGIIE